MAEVWDAAPADEGRNPGEAGTLTAGPGPKSHLNGNFSR